MQLTSQSKQTCLYCTTELSVVIPYQDSRITGSHHMTHKTNLCLLNLHNYSTVYSYCLEMAEQALKRLEEQLNCSICLDTFTDPKLLQCFHVYCQQCLVPLGVRDQQGQLSLDHLPNLSSGHTHSTQWSGRPPVGIPYQPPPRNSRFFQESSESTNQFGSGSWRYCSRKPSKKCCSILF